MMMIQCHRKQEELLCLYNLLGNVMNDQMMKNRHRQLKKNIEIILFKMFIIYMVRRIIVIYSTSMYHTNKYVQY